MTDYPVDQVNDSYINGAVATDPGWRNDGNPATTLSLPTDADSEWIFDFEDDLTGITGIINFRVDVTVVSGTGSLFWDFAFDKGATFVAFSGTMPVDGPGEHSLVASGPYFVGTAGGHTYDGIYDVLERIANVTGYHHGYGSLETTGGSGPIVLSEFSVIFFTARYSAQVRQRPADAGGLASHRRVYPPPRNRRIVGGQR